MKNKYLLSIGSNNQPEESLQKAREALQKQFSEILFGKELQTKPVGLEPDTPFFINQLAVGYTDYSSNTIIKALKEIEQQLGRTTSDKQKGIIRIDIDLLQYNDILIKPKDLELSYIQILLRDPLFRMPMTEAIRPE